MQNDKVARAADVQYNYCVCKYSVNPSNCSSNAANDSAHYSLTTRYILIKFCILLDFSLTVKAATLIFISGCGLAISSAKKGKSGFIHNLLKS